jgi:hypothetical protein
MPAAAAQTVKNASPTNSIAIVLLSAAGRKVPESTIAIGLRKRLTGTGLTSPLCLARAAFLRQAFVFS